ncbi:MAG: nucleotidyltransferase family protein, partial [Rhodospirillales bacterium]
FHDAHAARPADVAMTMALFTTDAPETCGIVTLDGNGVVRAFHEKMTEPHGNLANGAVYICEPEIIEYIASLGRPVIDFSTEVIPHFMGRILGYRVSGYYRDIGTLESLERARREFPAPS